MNTWFYGFPKTREVVVGTSAITADDGQTVPAPARLVVIKADADNGGIVYVTGNEATVTAETGSTNDTAGWPLAAGNETPPFWCNGLDKIQLIASAVSQKVYVLYHTGEE